MAVLTEEMKLKIVQAFACYDTPTQVAKMIKEEFGIEVTRQQVQHYDPTRAGGAKMKKKLHDLFIVTRANFLEKTAEIPIAQQSYRLRVLQRALLKVEGQGNTALLREILEQAAKEVGGAFTNRRELTGLGGGPVQAQQIPAPVDPVDAAAAYTKMMQG